jgi:hypothetical protein
MRIGLPILVVAIITWQFRTLWSPFVNTFSSIPPWIFIPLCLGLALQELSFGIVWQRILIILGTYLPILKSSRIYLASEFTRYIPGNIWHVMARILWGSQFHLSRKIIFTSVIVELSTKLIAGAGVFLISLLFWSRENIAAGSNLPLYITGAGVLLVLLLIIIHPSILQYTLNRGLRLLKKEPLVIDVRYKQMIGIVGLWTISWGFAGIAFAALVTPFVTMSYLAVLPLAIGTYAFAWDIGFLSFITPSGLGFREGAIATLLLFLLHISIVQGVAIALVMRGVSLGIELICVGYAYATLEHIATKENESVAAA